MSRPANPLARYRTYSYHHILVACDNDAAADYISNTSDINVFSTLGARRSVESRRIDQRNDTTGSEDRLRIGNYYVILNGMIDTTFVVKEATWFTMTAASTDATDRFNSVAVEGSMIIEEPGGVLFFNELNAAANALRTDPVGIIFVLKTIFVGHNDDGTTDYISNVQPLRFIMYDVTGTFDITGGVYNISFMGVSNGAARLPQYSRGAELVSFTPEETTLRESLTQLAEEMNKRSRTNRDCLVKRLRELYDDKRVEVDGEQEGLERLREVQYKIEVQDPYGDSEYIVDGWSERESDDTGEDKKGAFKFPESCTVEQAIRHIMERCSRVLKDRTEGRDGIKYIYKIYSEISMVDRDDEGIVTPDGTREYDVVVVKYIIRRFAQVANQTLDRVLGLNRLDPQEEGIGAEERARREEQQELNERIIRQNTIEFDYFYTGKNTDIINFDIKMEMGLAFLQTLATSNTIPTQAEQITSIRRMNTNVAVGEGKKGEAVPDGLDQKIIIRNRTPVFPATKVKDVLLRNAGNPKDTTLFQAYLSRHAALENIEAKVTILGNPYLMSQTNRPAGSSGRKVDTEGDPNDEENVLLNWDTIPALSRINIYMPVNNETPSSQERFERVSFWYTGYYYLYGIQHKFADGEFTQELDMLSIPNESLLDEQNGEEYLEACGIQDKKNEDSSPTGEEIVDDAASDETKERAEEKRRRTSGEIRRASRARRASE